MLTPYCILLCSRSSLALTFSFSHIRSFGHLLFDVDLRSPHLLPLASTSHAARSLDRLCWHGNADARWLVGTEEWVSVSNHLIGPYPAFSFRHPRYCFAWPRWFSRSASTWMRLVVDRTNYRLLRKSAPLTSSSSCPFSSPSYPNFSPAKSVCRYFESESFYREFFAPVELSNN